MVTVVPSILVLGENSDLAGQWTIAYLHVAKEGGRRNTPFGYASQVSTAVAPNSCLYLFADRKLFNREAQSGSLPVKS